MDFTLRHLYKDKTLIPPLTLEVDSLSEPKQLSLCIMSLERLFLSYFKKYDSSGLNEFRDFLEILEGAVLKGEVVSEAEEERLESWSESYMVRIDEDKTLTPWERDSMEVIFYENRLYYMTRSLIGVCRNKSPLNQLLIYKVGIDLCELYERDYMYPTEADGKTLAQFLAPKHPDISVALKKAGELNKLLDEGKIQQEEYFEAVRALRGLCDHYSDDKDRYFELKASKTARFQSPQDLVLMHKEAKRVEDDILYLKQAAELDPDELMARFREYRQVDILSMS